MNEIEDVIATEELTNHDAFFGFPLGYGGEFDFFGWEGTTHVQRVTDNVFSICLMSNSDNDHKMVSGMVGDTIRLSHNETIRLENYVHDELQVSYRGVW